MGALSVMSMITTPNEFLCYQPVILGFTFLISTGILVILLFIYGVVKIETDKGKLAILLSFLFVVFYIVTTHAPE